MPVVGRDGLILARAWGERVAAHRGLTVAGFPNFFMLLGPNTGLGHNSVVLMIEAQVEYVLACLAEMKARTLAAIEPTPEAQARDLAEVEARLSASIWQQGGCASWYQDAQGRNVALWPGTVVAYRRAMRVPDWSEFVLTPVSVSAGLSGQENGAGNPLSPRAGRGFRPLAGGERSAGESRSEGEGVFPEEAPPEAPPHPRGEPAVRSSLHLLNGDAALSPPAGRGKPAPFP